MPVLDEPHLSPMTPTTYTLKADDQSSPADRENQRFWEGMGDYSQSRLPRFWSTVPEKSLYFQLPKGIRFCAYLRVNSVETSLVCG